MLPRHQTKTPTIGQNERSPGFTGDLLRRVGRVLGGGPSKRLADDSCGSLIGARHEVAVDLQGRRCVPVTETGRHGGDGFPGIQEKRRLQVAEVVQTRLYAELSAEPAPGLADPVRRKRLVASG